MYTMLSFYLILSYSLNVQYIIWKKNKPKPKLNILKKFSKTFRLVKWKKK